MIFYNNSLYAFSGMLPNIAQQVLVGKEHNGQKLTLPLLIVWD